MLSKKGPHASVPFCYTIFRDLDSLKKFTPNNKGFILLWFHPLCFLFRSGVLYQTF